MSFDFHIRAYHGAQLEICKIPDDIGSLSAMRSLCRTGTDVHAICYPSSYGTIALNILLDIDDNVDGMLVGIAYDKSHVIYV